MLQEEFGIDFTHYKPSTVTRRIERRLALARSQDIEEYVRRLKSERDELDVLYRDLLIGVTRFFRDEQAFEVLEEQVLPELLQREPRDAPLRVWVAGCATGEEAYSLAILLAGADGRSWASGRSRSSRPTFTAARWSRRRAPSTAKRRWPASRPSASRATSSDRATATRSCRTLRQMVVFAQHNVIKDAPFTRVDLVTCRNLLIYLQPAAQQKVLSLFHFALNRGGVLFLGPSETAGPVARGFETVDKHWRVYRKRSDARIPVDPRVQPLASAEARVAIAPFPADRWTPFAVAAARDLRRAARAGHAAEPARQRARRADPRVRRREALPASARRPPGARRPRAGRPRAEDGARRRPEARADRACRDRLRSVRLPESDGERPYKVTIQRVANRSSGTPHLLVSFEAVGGRRAAVHRRRADRDRSGVARAARGAGGRAHPHQGEPAGGDRGARDQQRGAAGVERGAAGVERRAAEHERRAPERQRGALHGQRRVPAQDRASSPS